MVLEKAGRARREDSRKKGKSRRKSMKLPLPSHVPRHSFDCRSGAVSPAAEWGNSPQGWTVLVAIGGAVEPSCKFLPFAPGRPEGSAQRFQLRRHVRPRSQARRLQTSVGPAPRSSPGGFLNRGRDRSWRCSWRNYASSEDSGPVHDRTISRSEPNGCGEAGAFARSRPQSSRARSKIS